MHKGIKLNGNIVIDFRSYDECGPGQVAWTDSIEGCKFLIISDKYSRLDVDCADDPSDDSPYIPYRGIAGIMRAAIFKKNLGFSIATDLDYSAAPSFEGKSSLKENGTFGYPWGSNSTYPGPINSSQYSYSDEPAVNMAKLLYPSQYAGDYDAPDDLDLGSSGSFDSMVDSSGDWQGSNQVFFSKRVLNFDIDISQLG